MTETALRLFFALPCPPELARPLCAWRDTLQVVGHPVPAANLHVTLAFLGNQPASQVPVLQKIAAGQTASACELRLDGLERWRTGPLVLTSSQPPQALTNLASNLHSDLCDAGFDCERRAYRPHLTLMRQAQGQVARTEPDWRLPVERFGLYVSEHGPHGIRYRLLSEWPLTPDS